MTRGASARDVTALAVAVLLSFAWYAPQLGFYSDDWAFLGRYITSADQTVAGLFNASYSAHHAMRPVQLWLCAALYRLFGIEPLGYHLFNAVLLVLNPILCYAIARELRVSRTIALPVALTYALLPSYSTDRFWYLAFAITLSMTACLTSVLADLKAAGANRPRSCVVWKTVAAAALLVSALSYEVATPLFLLVPLLMIARSSQEYGFSRPRVLYLTVLIAINVLLLAGVTAFKLRNTVRLGAEQGLATQITAIARHAIRPDMPDGGYGLNIFSAVRVHFQDYGPPLPATALNVAGRLPRAPLWLTVVFMLAAVAYLTHATAQERWPSFREWAALALAGVTIFALGYAIFLTNYNVQFTATGIANRSAIAAALGAAMLLVGCIGALVSPLSRTRFGAFAFAAVIAAFASSGMIIINFVAEHWIDAYAAEQRLLAGIRRRLPTLPPHSTLLLDGVCPYIGPAIVFESNWDLAGALQAIYRDETLRADVVTRRLVVGDAGITTTIYGQPTTYPYGHRLMVYDAKSNGVEPLPDAASARSYFAHSTHAESCPPGQEGIGVKLF